MPGLYVHIPFCAAKCAYCDFLSFAKCNAEIEPYMKELLVELKGYASPSKRKRFGKKKPVDRPIDTIFFGGGTPTVVPTELLAEALGAARADFDVAEGAEITIEANPETVDYDGLCVLRQAGFNRISFGVQSFDDPLLRQIGRIHSAETAERAAIYARQAGFENINLDLMFGLPGQNMADWAATLDRAIALAPEHLSCYSLIVEESTPLGKEENLVLPDDETDRGMYAMAKERLAQAGYEQYEISNFAKPGFASRHNCMYWTGGDYIGVGLGAHSLLDDQRICNTDSLVRYLSGDYGREVLETLDVMDRRAEFMILGLRMTKGVSESEFQARFRRSFDQVFGEEIDALMREGLLEREGDWLRLTARGVDLSNRVFVRFLSTED